MNETVRVAFVGAGGHATGSLYPQLHRVPDLDLVAVCDLVREKAEHNARWFGGREVYTDVEEMLANEELDGVYICGLPDMMDEVGLQALEAGLPIFVEKPSAIDVPKARELAQAADDRGLWGMVAFMKRFAPAYVTARDIVGAADFNGLQMLEVAFTQGPYPQWSGIEDTMLAMLTGQSCHIFDLVRFFGGDVEWVQVTKRWLDADRMGLFVSCQFTSGAIGVMNLNTLEGWEDDPWQDIRERLHCVGIGESVTVDEMLYVTHHRPGQPWCGIENKPFGHALGRLQPNWGAFVADDLCGYRGEIAYFAQCLREGRPPEQGADLWDGAKSLELTEAICESATSDGARVAVPVR